MNTYKMKLLPKYFDELRRGSKYIEIRCNDEKRKKIKVEDRIVFINTETGEEADTTVLALEHYSSFEELIWVKSSITLLPENSLNPLLRLFIIQL